MTTSAVTFIHSPSDGGHRIFKADRKPDHSALLPPCCEKPKREHPLSGDGSNPLSSACSLGRHNLELVRVYRPSVVV